jgi:hypothetical protein
MIPRNGQEMSNAGHRKLFGDLFWNISPLPQDQGFENSRGEGVRFLCEKIADVISHPLHHAERGVFRGFSDFDPGGLLVQKSNRVNSFKRKIAFVGKSAWIMKSMRTMEFTPESKAVPHLEGWMFLFQKDQESAFDSKTLVGVDDPLGANPYLRSPLGLLRRTIERPFQRDPIEPNKTGNVRGREGWTDIVMDG